MLTISISGTISRPRPWLRLPWTEWYPLVTWWSPGVVELKGKLGGGGKQLAMRCGLHSDDGVLVTNKRMIPLCVIWEYKKKTVICVSEKKPSSNTRYANAWVSDSLAPRIMKNYKWFYLCYLYIWEWRLKYLRVF